MTVLEAQKNRKHFYNTEFLQELRSVFRKSAFIKVSAISLRLSARCYSIKTQLFCKKELAVRSIFRVLVHQPQAKFSFGLRLMDKYPKY